MGPLTFQIPGQSIKFRDFTTAVSVPCMITWQRGGLLLVGFLRSQDSPASPSFNFSVWLICSRTNNGRRRVKNRSVTEYKLLSKKRFIVYAHFYTGRRKIFHYFETGKRSLGSILTNSYTTPPTSPSPLTFRYCGCDNFCARDEKDSRDPTNSPQKKESKQNKTKRADHLVTTLFDHLLLYDLAMSCCALVLDYCYAEMYKKKKKYFKSVTVAFIWDTN